MRPTTAVKTPPRRDWEVYEAWTWMPSAQTYRSLEHRWQYSTHLWEGIKAFYRRNPIQLIQQGRAVARRLHVEVLAARMAVMEMWFEHVTAPLHRQWLRRTRVRGQSRLYAASDLFCHARRVNHISVTAASQPRIIHTGMHVYPLMPRSRPMLRCMSCMVMLGMLLCSSNLLLVPISAKSFGFFLVTSIQVIILCSLSLGPLLVMALTTRHICTNDTKAAGGGRVGVELHLRA